MAYFDKISIDGTSYDVRDSEAASFINDASGDIDNLTQWSLTPFADVKRYGAVGNGSTDDSQAFTSAKSSGNVIFVPFGSYNIQNFNPSGCKMVIAPNVTFVNPPDGLETTNVGVFRAYSFESSQPVYSQFAISVTDDTTDSAPSEGWVKSAFRIDTTVTSSNSYYNWGLVSTLDNQSSNQNTENTAAFFQARATNDRKTWGSLSEILDLSRNPTSGKVGIEITCKATGPDVNNNRVGLDLAVHNSVTTPGAEKVVWGYGVRVGAEGSSTSSINRAFEAVNATFMSILRATNCVITGNAIDLTEATCQGNAIALATGQLLSVGSNCRILQDPSSPRFLFQIDGATVGYIDGSGWHNGAPA